MMMILVILKSEISQKIQVVILDNALAELKQKGVTKLILDVRNNPGGLLNQAVEVTDRFLNKRKPYSLYQGSF